MPQFSERAILVIQIDAYKRGYGVVEQRSGIVRKAGLAPCQHFILEKLAVRCDSQPFISIREGTRPRRRWPYLAAFNRISARRDVLSRYPIAGPVISAWPPSQAGGLDSVWSLWRFCGAHQNSPAMLARSRRFAVRLH